MARSIWTGVITFGLASLPVDLYTATEDHTVHFHQLQRGTADRIRSRRVNERTGREVPSDNIVKGYEFAESEYIVVEPDELDQIGPGRSQTIDITDFVDLSDIEPVYFDRTYYVAPRGKEYTKVYELLRAALEESDKAGIATFVMRGKQYLTALRAEERLLVLQTLHWADEVRDPGKELPELPSNRAGKGKELTLAMQLVDALSAPWNPGGITIPTRRRSVSWCRRRPRARRSRWRIRSRRGCGMARTAARRVLGRRRVAASRRNPPARPVVSGRSD
ncbi:non-homologous end joining protein Ku [Streptomyces mirabilis]|uniref:non-homologous end joining protein Ku n=1 Tax=Streptomyces mirabilis TaxID=68239 RepID=UPI00369F0D7C